MSLRCIGALLGLLPLAAFAQSAALEIHVVDGEGAAHAAGSRSVKCLTVKVTNELGQAVPQALVSFRLPESGPGGVFLNGLATEVVTTGEDGLAAAPAVRWNNQEGPFQIRVVAARGQSRAGTVVSQYLSAEGIRSQTARHGSNSAPARRSAGLRRKWLVVGLVAAGATGLGLSTAWAAGSRQQTTKTPEPTRIGSPVIAVGRP